MSGNSIGKLFTVTTFGESHGVAYGCIVDGCPPGLRLAVADIQTELNLRRAGTSKLVSQRRELDEVQVLSGVFDGLTTGTPIGLLVANTDQRARDYEKIKDQFRPGHADFTYQKKYGIRDHRGGGRASARETVMRVAAGAIAKKYLRDYFQIEIQGRLVQVGDLIVANLQDKELENLILNLRKQGDSIGAKIQLQACNVPVGIGAPVFNRLDADLAQALMGINAVKGVEIGAGFACVTQKGSEHRDEMTQQGFLSNHAGGILGGISTGQNITATIALKPTPSITLPARSLDKHGNEISVSTRGRHDPCVGIRATPIAEAMMAIVIMDHVLRDRGQNGNVLR